MTQYLLKLKSSQLERLGRGHSPWRMWSSVIARQRYPLQSFTAFQYSTTQTMLDHRQLRRGQPRPPQVQHPPKSGEIPSFSAQSVVTSGTDRLNAAVPPSHTRMMGRLLQSLYATTMTL